MRSTIVFSIVSVLVQQVSQTAAQLDSTNVLGHSAYVASRVRRAADIDLNSSDYLKRLVQRLDAGLAPNPPVIAPVERQAAPAPSNITMAMIPAPTAPVNQNPMMNDTQAACMSVLMNTSPSDDSGMAACFNINFFDNSTGAFQANMLLYKLAAPAGNWSYLQAGSVHLSLSFPGATASTQPTVAQKVKRDAAAVAATPIRRVISTRSTSTPMMLEAYTLLGSISAPLNTPSQLMNMTIMRAALTPFISMTAMSTGGMNLTSNMTASTGAAFVNGIFSDADIAQKSVALQALATVAPAPFVLPGVTLGMFPTALIVVTSWVTIFVGAVGYGTWGRKQWKKAYRAGRPNASGK